MSNCARSSKDGVKTPGRSDLDLFGSLSDCQSVEELHAATTRTVKQLGFEHFIYGVRVNLPLTQPYQFVLSGYPKEWWARYIEAGYEGIDPAVLHCCRDRRVTPMIWRNQGFRNGMVAKLWGEAKELGLASGVTFPVQGNNAEIALLSLATSRSPRQANRDITDTLGQSQLLTYYLHDAVQRVVLSRLVNH